MNDRHRKIEKLRNQEQRRIEMRRLQMISNFITNTAAEVEKAMVRTIAGTARFINDVARTLEKININMKLQGNTKEDEKE